MSGIDWTALIHLGEVAAGGYLAASTLHWLLTDVAIPMFGLFVTWRVAANLRRAVAIWAESKRKAVADVPPPVATVQPEPENVRYISRVHTRLR